MDQEKAAGHFHDSESGDVFDLYNACNGAMRNGLLDVSKLDELTPEELEVLDVKRLRDVWLHTASGCLECAGIIMTLNLARARPGADADETCLEEVPAIESATT